MTDAQTLLDLALRCEKATGPDRELDALIWLAATPGATREQRTVKSSKSLWPDYQIDETREASGALIIVPAFTDSIDAAMTLRSAGFGWNMQGNETVNYAVVKGHDGKGTTPALALCAAALRARASLETST